MRNGIEIQNAKRKSLEEKQNQEKVKLEQQLAALQQSLNQLNTKHGNEKTMLENKSKKENLSRLSKILREKSGKLKNGNSI